MGNRPGEGIGDTRRLTGWRTDTSSFESLYTHTRAGTSYTAQTSCLIRSTFEPGNYAVPKQLVITVDAVKYDIYFFFVKSRRKYFGFLSHANFFIAIMSVLQKN